MTTVETAPSWPKDYDPALEVIAKSNSLFIAILRPRRLNKPGRRFISYTPQLPKIINEFGEFKFNFGEEVDPDNGDPKARPGNHYHNKKVEIFYPDSEIPLFVYLEHVETGEKAVVVLVEKERETITQFLVRPKVAHTIINPSITVVKYKILANMSEDEAIKTDVVPHQIDVSSFPLPTTLSLKTAK